MKTMKKLLAVLAIVLLIVQTGAASVFAETAGYTTNNFNVDVTVNEDHSMYVEETIHVDFQQAKHGIYRYIPYEAGIYTIKNIDVEGEEYQVETQMENGVNQKIIRIGSEHSTIKGKHTYKIRYDIIGYEDKLTSADWFSLDLIPTGWETPIEKTKAIVRFPKPVDPDAFQLYSGSYGLAENFYKIDAKYHPDDMTVTLTSKQLAKGSGITLNAELPDGYWVGAASRDWMMIPLNTVMILLPVLMAVLWFLFGRDPKVIKTVEFYPPEGMTPAEIGYIIDGTVDTKDIMSLLIYFASKGWLSIHENEEEKFELIKLRDIDPKEKRFAKTVFNALFIRSDKVKLDNLPENFGDMFLASKSQLRGFYRGENALFTASSVLCRGLGMILMFVPGVAAVVMAAVISFNYMYLVMLIPVITLLLIGLFMIIMVFDRRAIYSKKRLTVLFMIGTLLILTGSLLAGETLSAAVDYLILTLLVVASEIVTFVFVLLMNKRTEKSAKWQGQILGFRDFLEAAEVPKLEMLVEEDPEYFYNIMPYAYVMGLSDKWAKKFENIKMSAPSWYDDSGYGSNRTFNTLWYLHMFNHCTRSFTSNTINSIASGSLDTGGGGGSGIGGGFSGGGFGGGGGGAW